MNGSADGISDKRFFRIHHNEMASPQYGFLYALLNMIGGENIGHNIDNQIVLGSLPEVYFH